jgi:hypothetical protein
MGRALSRIEKQGRRSSAKFRQVLTLEGRPRRIVARRLILLFQGFTIQLDAGMRLGNQ